MNNLSVMPNPMEMEEGQNLTASHLVQRKFWKNPKFVGGVGLFALVVFLVGDGSAGKLFTGVPLTSKSSPSTAPSDSAATSMPSGSTVYQPELPKKTESLTTGQVQESTPVIQEGPSQGSDARDWYERINAWRQGIPSPASAVMTEAQTGSRVGQVYMQATQELYGGGGGFTPSARRGGPDQDIRLERPHNIASPRAQEAPGSSPGPILVQGGSLRTWSYNSPAVEQVQVVLTTEGRPMDADMELWHGPDNTPFKLRIYSENGDVYPFSTVIETPRAPNTVALRNIGQIEFPFAADLTAYNDAFRPSPETAATTTTIQGGALRTWPFDPTVKSVEVLITTQGNPLNARIELLQGPNNNKQVVEVYTEDGIDRPFFCIIETPGSGNVVRVVNTGPVEFPVFAAATPHFIDPHADAGVVLGGDQNW